MLSVRLPTPLENQLVAYCESSQLSKSAVVQRALEIHLQAATAYLRRANAANPFSAARGTGNRQFTTDQIMQMSRGEDWKAP